MGSVLVIILASLLCGGILLAATSRFRILGIVLCVMACAAVLVPALLLWNHYGAHKTLRVDIPVNDLSPVSATYVVPKGDYLLRLMRTDTAPDAEPPGLAELTFSLDDGPSETCEEKIASGRNWVGLKEITIPKNATKLHVTVRTEHTDGNWSFQLARDQLL